MNFLIFHTSYSNQVFILKSTRNIVKKHVPDNFKKFSRTTGSISIKLSTYHTRVNGILVSSHKGPCPFLKGDNSHIKYVDNMKKKTSSNSLSQL